MLLSKTSEKKIRTEVGQLPNISFLKNPELALVKQTQHVKASLQPAFLIDSFKTDSLEEAAIDCVIFLNPSFYQGNAKIVDAARARYKTWCKELSDLHIKNKEEAEANKPKVVSKPVSEKHAEELDYLIDGIIKGKITKVTPMLVNYVVKADKDFLKAAKESNDSDGSEEQDKEYWNRRQLVNELLTDVISANGKAVIKKKRGADAEVAVEEVKAKRKATPVKTLKSDNVKVGVAPDVIKSNISIYDSWSIIEESGGHILIMPPVTVVSNKAARFTPSKDFHFISSAKAKQFVKKTGIELKSLGTVKRILAALRAADIQYKTDQPRSVTASEVGKFTVLSFIKPE